MILLTYCTVSMMARSFTLILIAFYLGCGGCYLLQAWLGCNAVLASSLSGLICTFVPLPRQFNRKEVYSAFYTGTFAGMSSNVLISGHSQVCIVSVIGAVVYLLAKPYLVGFGGKMGAIALGSSLFLILMRLLG